MQPLNKIILVLLDSKCCAMTYDSENICVLRRKKENGIVVSYQYGLWELAVHSMELTVCCMNISS